MFEKFSKKLKEIQDKSIPVSNEGCKYPIGFAIMAAGVANRYQAPDPEVPDTPEEIKRKSAKRGTIKPDNKLTSDFLGKPIISWVIDSAAEIDCASRVVICREHETAILVPKDGFRVVWNTGKDTSPHVTIQFAVVAMPPDVKGCLFAVGDQPLLTSASLTKLCDKFMEDQEKIVMLSSNGVPGNPVIFPASLFEELMTLDEGQSGKVIIERHPELVVTVEAASSDELLDIDTKEERRLAIEKFAPAKEE